MCSVNSRRCTVRRGPCSSGSAAQRDRVGCHQRTTASRSTSPEKSAVLPATSSSTGWSLRSTMTSGVMPMPRNSRTLCCVGFVFSSLLAAR